MCRLREKTNPVPLQHRVCLIITGGDGGISTRVLNATGKIIYIFSKLFDNTPSEAGITYQTHKSFRRSVYKITKIFGKIPKPQVFPYSGFGYTPKISPEKNAKGAQLRVNFSVLGDKCVFGIFIFLAK